MGNGQKGEAFWGEKNEPDRQSAGRRRLGIIDGKATGHYRVYIRAAISLHRGPVNLALQNWPRLADQVAGRREDSYQSFTQSTVVG